MTGPSQKFCDDIATINSIEAVPSIIRVVCHATGKGRRFRVAPIASSESHGKVTGRRQIEDFSRPRPCSRWLDLG
jgi:hypothetical protein